MEKIAGANPGGNRSRELTLWVGQNEQEPRLHLWIHPPEAAGGWEIRLLHAELKEALDRVAGAAGEAAPEDTASGELIAYFQNGRWRQALRRYAQFAEESGWTVGHRLELYGQASIVFDAANTDELRQEAFNYLYEALRGYWQVFRGATSHWDEETAYTFFSENLDDCGPKSVRTLESLSRNEMRKIVLPFLEKLRDIKTVPTGGYPTMAASRFLHFFNPRLFPNFDNAVINQQVLQVFGPDFDKYCADAGIADWDEEPAFYAQYMLWASRHVQLADPELTADFVTWCKAQVEEDEETSEMLGAIGQHQATLFEFVAVGAAKLAVEG